MPELDTIDIQFDTYFSGLSPEPSIIGKAMSIRLLMAFVVLFVVVNYFLKHRKTCEPQICLIMFCQFYDFKCLARQCLQCHYDRN